MSLAKSGLSGSPAKAVFVLLVVLGAVTAYTVCGNATYSLVIIKLLALICIVGLLALGFDDGDGEFFQSFAIVSVIYMPLLIYSSFIQTPLLYLTGILLPIALLVAYVIEAANLKTATEKIYAAWVVTGIVVTLGRLGFLGDHDWPEYIAARFGIARSDLNWFWDTRVVITALLLMVVAARSVGEAFSEIRPDVPGIGDPPEFGTNSSGLAGAILDPFVILLNAFLTALWKLANGLWILVVTILTYVWWILVAFALTLAEATIDTPIWKLAMRGSTAGMLVYFIGVSLRWIAPIVQSYLLAPTGMAAIVPFGIILVATILWAAGTAVHTCLLAGTPVRGHLELVGGGNAAIVVAFFCAGILLHLIAWTNILTIANFGTLGPFSVTMVTVLTLIVAGEILSRVKGGSRPKARSAGRY